MICSSFFTFSLKDSGSTADCKVFSWQAEDAQPCFETVGAPLLKHSKWRFFLLSFERLPAGKESKQGDAPMIEKSEAADAYNGNLQLVYRVVYI